MQCALAWLSWSLWAEPRTDCFHNTGQAQYTILPRFSALNPNLQEWTKAASVRINPNAPPRKATRTDQGTVPGAFDSPNALEDSKNTCFWNEPKRSQSFRRISELRRAGKQGFWKAPTLCFCGRSSRNASVELSFVFLPMLFLSPRGNHSAHQGIGSCLAQTLTQTPVDNHQRTADRSLSFKQFLWLVRVPIA